MLRHSEPCHFICQ